MKVIIKQVGFGIGFFTSIFNIWFPTFSILSQILNSIFLLCSGVIIVFYYLKQEKEKKQDE